jgi:hypothetical protein
VFAPFVVCSALNRSTMVKPRCYVDYAVIVTRITSASQYQNLHNGNHSINTVDTHFTPDIRGTSGLLLQLSQVGLLGHSQLGLVLHGLRVEPVARQTWMSATAALDMLPSPH